MSTKNSIAAAIHTSLRAVTYAWKNSFTYSAGALFSGLVIALVPAAQVEVMKYLIDSLAPGSSPVLPIMLAALAAVVISLTTAASGTWCSSANWTCDGHTRMT